jgi:glycosyltransferase domain-containing protein
MSDKVNKISLLSNLTVVICSFERPNELLETINYMEPLGVEIVVMDGSTKPSTDSVLSQNPRVRYFHRPEDSYLQRMGLASSLVITPYTLSMADDEYYIPTALESAITFLDENPDYTSCCGETTGFQVSLDGVCWVETYPETRGFEARSTNNFERLKNHLSKYRVCAYYSVVRTGAWVAAWESIAQEQFTPFGITEIQFEAAISFHGKMKVLPELMWLRNLVTEPIRISGVEGMDDSDSFPAWWVDRSSASDKAAFLSRMTQVLKNMKKDQSQPDIRQLEKAIKRAFSSYARYWGKSSILLRTLISNIGTRLFLLENLPMRVFDPNDISKIVSPQAIIDYQQIANISSRIINTQSRGK